MDLTSMWRLRRWSFLIDLIDQLPSNSRTTEAILNDEEIAEEILAQRESGDTSDGAWHPRFSEFGQTQQMLAQIIDQLSGLQATTVAAAGGDPKTSRPYPRPQSAVDRLKRKREQESQNQILDLFGGGTFINP